MLCNHCGADNLDGSVYCCQCAKPFYDISDGDKNVRKRNVWLKMILLVFCGVVIAGVFFPFISMEYGADQTISLIDSENGGFILCFAVIGLVHALINKFIPVCVTGVFSLALFFYEQWKFNKQFEVDEYGMLLKLLFKKGAGYYLSIFGMLGMIIFGIVFAIIKRNKQNAVD